jgi:hypothetical protein
MKKRISLLLCTLALVSVALVNQPATAAETAACFKPACFASPPCCFASECARWCATTTGGVPYCAGTSPGLGGCCACDVVEL